ncbi:sn-glycerol-1-phosphate dehydrogenase [Metabacillus endolithicus]|uniref:Sn-glycerol-1-phosphate dehydrogenase n=1 Tax=Metabacillus endolithicus TaxID=1535204 RepID=A0ABW5BV20_9BACI
MITLNELKHQSKACTCGNNHYDILIDNIVISDQALQQVVPYLESKQFKKVAIIADEHTDDVVGKTISNLIREANIANSKSILQPNAQGDVVADEAALIEAMLGIPRDVDVVIAVGSGTIHDIVRFASFKMGKPFISVPTAPSVDGFNSMGAPVIIKGVKLTYQMQSPLAVFADLSILIGAPKEMIAAGFADMIGKYTSLADWKFSHLVADEPYCPLSARLTQEALDGCVNSVEQIIQAEKDGIKILMESLIQSGLAMLLVGHSSPASGGEHHLSHFWEMDFIKNAKTQVLHGAKVGVSTQLVLDLYKNQMLELIYSDDKLQELSTNKADAVLKQQDELVQVLKALPNSSDIAAMLKSLQGAVTPSDLGIPSELVSESLRKAHKLRDRYTMLKFWNEHVGLHEYV